MRVTSRAPVRIDFAGGWTDVNIFAQGAGGLVVNAAINHYVSGTLEVKDESETVSPPLSHSAGQGQEGIGVSYHSDVPAGSGLGARSPAGFERPAAEALASSRQPATTPRDRFTPGSFTRYEIQRPSPTAHARRHWAR